MIVDAHHHLWRRDRAGAWLEADGMDPIRRSFTPADLETELDAAGVDRTVLVEGGRCDPEEAAELFAYAGATPRIAAVVAWADPADADLDATLKGYRALDTGEWLAGVRSQIQSESDPGYLDRADVRRGLRTIAAAGLVFDLVIRADQIDAAARAARELPEVRFVLDHLGKPDLGGFTAWAAALGRLAACPNVTAKLSSITQERFVTEALRVFGPSRLMFGSDWPVCLLGTSYAGARDALTTALPRLPAYASGLIFGGNAVRVYRLRSRGR